MRKFLSNFFYGLLMGAIIAVLLYVLGFVIELGNCACGILSCDCDRGDAIPFMWSSDSFLTCITWTTIGGGIIGGIYGAVLGIQEKNARDAAFSAEEAEKAKMQREHNAVTLKNDVNGKYTTVHVIQKEASVYDIPTEYTSIELQKEGWLALKNAYDSNSELQSILEEVNN